MSAFYNGMKYSSLQTRSEGHIGNKNPILGIGHVSHDEPQFDVEGNKGAGSRGRKTLRSRQFWQMQHPAASGNNGHYSNQPQQQPHSQSGPLTAVTDSRREGLFEESGHQSSMQGQLQPQPAQQQAQMHDNQPHHSANRRASFANFASNTGTDIDSWRKTAGQQDKGKRLVKHGSHRASAASSVDVDPEHYRISNNVNLSLRKRQHGELKMQFRTPSDKYFGGSTTSDINKEYNNRAGTALRENPDERPPERGLLRASQEFGKNPITGDGHIAWDEGDRDLDGRHGSGTRGAAGNRTSNHQNAPHMGR